MNPLTLVKRLQNINSKEAELGISEEASWHAKYKDSAYVFVGGIPFDLTEGDLLAVFAQYGEIVDVNLVRDKGTGKSKGFAFVAYEDQRSTNLAVDNLNGAMVAGRIIRVDHVGNYKKKEEEDEETLQQKREARGVCRAFQRGECTRGASCKFSHDEQRAANTGWGPQDKGPRWEHDSFENLKKGDKRFAKEGPSGSHLKQSDKREDKIFRRQDANEIDRKSRDNYQMEDQKRLGRHENDDFGPRSREDSHKGEEKRSRRHGDDEFEPKSKEDYHSRDEKRFRRHGEDEFDPKSREDYHRRDEKRLRRHEDDQSEPKSREDYRRDERRLRRSSGDELEPRSRDNDQWRERNRLKRRESGSYLEEDDDKQVREKRSDRGRDYFSSRREEKDDHRRKSER